MVQLIENKIMSAELSEYTFNQNMQIYIDQLNERFHMKV